MGERFTLDQAVLIPGTPIFGCPECFDPWESEPSCEHYTEGQTHERPMRVFLSPLTGRAYATNDYEDSPTLGLTVANTKHDVTADVVHDLMAAAWARGWNECNTAAEGASPPNPYRPTPSRGDETTPGVGRGGEG